MLTQTKNSIMQLLEQFRQDPRVNKINLTAGIYTDESGVCPILDSVRAAESDRVYNQPSKANYHLAGAPDFHQAVRTLLFPTLKNSSDLDHVQVIQTLGATGALHLAGKLVHHYAPTAKIWICSPTWENHPAALSSHPGDIGSYRYQSANQDEVCIDTILEDLQAASPGDVVLMHACCHNPTGMDPTLSQWERLADFCAERQLIPLFDFAYQGFAHSFERDAAPFVIFKERLDMFMICSSFSKNMSIYDERTGALTLFIKEAEKLAEYFTTAKKYIRSSYSMPPTHGSYVVSYIINDPTRYARWEQEVTGMREDLKQRRAAFFAELNRIGIADQVLAFRQQNGMFVCLNLTQEQIDTLRDEHGIYMLDNGRISIASLTSANLPKLCEALLRVI